MRGNVMNETGTRVEQLKVCEGRGGEKRPLEDAKVQ